MSLGWSTESALLSPMAGDDAPAADRNKGVAARKERDERELADAGPVAGDEVVAALRAKSELYDNIKSGVVPVDSNSCLVDFHHSKAGSGSRPIPPLPDPVVPISITEPSSAWSWSRGGKADGASDEIGSSSSSSSSSDGTSIHSDVGGGLDSSTRFKKLASSEAEAEVMGMGSLNPIHGLEDGHMSSDTDGACSSPGPNGGPEHSPEMSIRQLLVGWTCLFLAIMSGSLIGPMFRYIQNEGISPVLAASWRCQCMSIFLSILAIFERCSSRTNRVAWLASNAELGGRPILLYVCIAGMGWAGNLLLWVSALRYTTVVRAGLAASMHPVFLIGYLGFKGQPLSSFEWVGTLITVMGLFVAAAKDLLGGGHSSVIGDFLGLISAICQVVVILNRHKIKKFVPLWQYSAITTLIVALVSAIVHLGVDRKGPEFIFCTQEDCVFGWMAPKWLQTMLLFSLVVSICIAGYNYSIQFVSPLVFSTVVLVDPAVSGFIAWVAGLEGAPPLLSWLGGVLIIGGIFYVSIGEYMRKLQREGATVPAWIQSLDVGFCLTRCMVFQRGYETMNQTQHDNSSRGGMVAMDVQSFADIEMSMSISSHSSRHNSICLSSSNLSLSVPDEEVEAVLIPSEQPVETSGAEPAMVVEVPEILLDGANPVPDGSSLRDGVRRRLSDAPPQTEDSVY